MMRKLYRYLFIDLLFLLLPDSDWGNRARGRLYGPLLAEVGRRLRVAPQARILRPENVSVGRDVYIGFGSYLGEGTIRIGDRALIGNAVSITASNHRRIAGSYHGTGYEDLGVTIDADSWIGAHACILAGASIGRGAMVAAGAVVRGRVRDNVLVGGVPARELKNLDEVEEEQRPRTP